MALDNAGAHTNRAVRAARPPAPAAGVTLSYLPRSSPEPNRIEGAWRHVTDEGPPVRSHRSLDDLPTAVEGALRNQAARLLDATNDLPEAA